MKNTSATLALLALFAGLTGPALALVNPATVVLGSAGNFTVLAETGISTTPGTPPDTALTGDIGVSGADTLLTGFGQTPANATASTVYSTSPLVTGKLYAFNYIAPTPSQLTTAVNDMITAYNDAAGRNPGDLVTELGTGTIGTPQGPLVRGVYKWSTGLNITTDLTLSGSASDIWVFIVAGNLDLSSSTSILLIGGALPSNIFWAVAGSSTLHTFSTFNGNILDQTLIAMQDGAVMHGKALAQTAVTLIANAVDSAPTGPGSGSPTSTPSISPTDSASPSPSNSATASVTPSMSPTISPSPSGSGSPSGTPTATVTPSVSNTTTNTPSASPSPTPNLTPIAFQQVILGAADGFSVLAGSGITIPGSSTANGYVGTFPTTTESGAGTLTSSCTDHSGDAVTQLAKTDLQLAYNDVSTRPSTTIPVELGGQTLLPGAYSQVSLQLTSGVLILDGNGDTNSVFTFYTGISTLTTAAGGSFSLVNGAKAKNVFFAVGSSATLGSGSHFVGTIIALQSITMVTGATIEGRVLAINGAVTLDANNIDTSTSASVPCTGPGTSTATPTISRTSTRTMSATSSPTVSRTSTPTPTSTRTPLGTSTPTPTVTVGIAILIISSPTPSPVPASTQPGDTYIYPSPARGDTAAVTYLMQENGDVTIKFYNQTGRLVDTVTDSKNPGWQSSQVTTAKFAAGTYYYVVSMLYGSGAKEAQQPRKFVVLH